MEAVSSGPHPASGFISSFKRRLSSILKFQWGVYSKPSPANTLEVFNLFCFCLIIGAAIGGLLHVWMVYNLNYQPFPSMVVSSTWGCIIVLLLLLLHPVRCVLSISVPSLGTKQGRKILISTALVIVVTSCIPNMTRNLSRSVDMIKCSSHSTAERILASTSQVSSALHDMKDFIKTIPNIVNSDRFLKIEQNVNVEEMKRGIRNASARLKAEFKAIQDTLEVTGHVTQKVIASSFIVLLLGSSVSYLVRYLTDLKHDNVCQTGRLQELLRARGVEELPEAYRKRLVRTRGWRMTQIELRRCLWGGTILGFYCLVCALVLGLDHLIYYVLQTSLSWTQDIPEVNTIISLRLKITILIIGLIREPVGEMNKDYRYGILLLPPDCVRPLSPPDPSVLSTTVALFLTALVMILGEVFSRRIRRKICSSFYRDREEERALYLRDKILLKLEDEGKIS
ncbi:osteoclast stimulatory transmembrane protein-like [Salvelinus fontinalis]|uniref:osteoclast stimulatory transmembrane protein-like n=1 Tax=Salvelinus fontinalis TaxID=8038 RepID=UPI0024860000|nr:osteoclast stimulatory transmembrane protein-like [Salvelinus fontinalis]